MKEKEKTDYQLFLDKVKEFELRPGSVKPIHIFRELYDLIEPLWEKIRNKPSTFSPGTHASTHENGGADEISVAGLSGELADDQPPKAHKTSHQNGGGDEIDVGGLSGELADNQPPKAHKTSHENGGGDEINVAGLSGELADDQPPKAHIHDDRYYTETEIDALLAGEPAKLAYDGGRNCLSLNDSDAQINYDSDYKCLLLDDADEDIEYDSDYQCLLITV